MHVVIRKKVCEGEKGYIQERLQTVKRWTDEEKIQYRDNHLPRVAVLGSGGGQRAQIAFLGVLRQLEKDELLDSILYLAGVSGSTWAMASLYDEADWSGKVCTLVDDAFTKMSKNQSSSFHDCLQWLKLRDQEGNLSLTDYWGVVTCYIKGVKLEKRTLTDEGQKGKGGAIPYPLYSAVDKASLHEKEKKELWFEMSPHEAGFTEPGAFVDTALLKQPFEGGKVQMDSRRKPMDMVQLQGICGSAFGDGKTNMENVKKYFKKCIADWFTSKYTGWFLDIFVKLAQLLEHCEDMEKCYDVLQKLKSTVEGDKRCCSVKSQISQMLMTFDDEGWKAMADLQQKQQYIERILEDLNQSLPKNPPKGMGYSYGNTSGWNDFTDGLYFLGRAFYLACRWNFGEMPNILYHLKGKDNQIPPGMCEKDIMHVIDAGLFLNSPYPPLLGGKREIDLIISFDFSDGNPFETVNVASDYAKTCKVPFPPIKMSNEDCPEPCHIFEEEGKPTVIHIPLFNKDNCKDRAGIEIQREKYKTFQMPYRDLDKIKDLAELAAMNVNFNKDVILKEIRKAAQRHN